MGAVKVGDQVFDENGRPCVVTAATPVMHDRECYEVRFSDGTVIVADAEHLWQTSTVAGRARRPRRGLPYWPDTDVRRVQDAMSNAQREPDRLVTTSEVLRDVGRQFATVLYRAIRDLPSEGRARREFYRRNGRDVSFWAPTYSRQLTYKALAERVTAPAGSSRVVQVDRAPITTAEIAASLAARGRLNHSVELCGPLDYPEQDLPIAPYTLGAWLGDGLSYHAAICCADQGILDNIQADGYTISNRRAPLEHGILLPRGQASVRSLLGGLGVIQNKHIPEPYLHTGIGQRRALLAGLLDTDGHCTVGGGVEFAATNERLARDVLELVLGLGYKATLRAKRCRGRTESTSVAYTVAFKPHEPVFRLARKLARQRLISQASTTRRRYIVEARPIDSVPVRCIAVSSASRLYLASRSCIPTHKVSVSTR